MLLEDHKIAATLQNEGGVMEVKRIVDIVDRGDYRRPPAGRLDPVAKGEHAKGRVGDDRRAHRLRCQQFYLLRAHHPLQRSCGAQKAGRAAIVKIDVDMLAS